MRTPGHISLLLPIAPMLLVLACSAEPSETPESSATASTSPAATPPDEDCGLGSIPSSTTVPYLDWNGWRSDYTWDSIEEEALSAEAIARVVVLAEVTQDVQTGLQQTACIWIEEVYRGSDLSSGDVLTVGWPAPIPFEPGPADIRVGFETGHEYILFLQDSGDRPYFEYPVSIDYTAWLRDVYPISTSGPGHAPDEESVQRLIDLVANSVDVTPLVDVELSRHGLERMGGLAAYSVTIPALPDAPGTLVSLSGQGDFIWRTRYQRVRDAIMAGGYDWNDMASAPVQVAGVSVREPDGRADLTVPAEFIFREGRLLAAFLGDYSNGAWPLDQYEYAFQNIAASAEGGSLPPSSRAPAMVNLADWFGVETIAAVRYKGGDARVTDGLFDTLESRQALAALLDHDSETHAMNVPISSVSQGCDATNFSIEVRDSWTFSLMFVSSTDRLYAEPDGFWVEAPVEFATLLGIEPHSTGQCY